MLAVMNGDTSTLRAINLCPNFNLKKQRGILLLGASEMPLEETMWKTVLAGTAALAIAGTSLAYAQQGPGGPDRAQRWRPSAEDISAFGDARIAAIHAGLKLTPEQEKNWPPVESALRDLAKQRSERFAAFASADRPKDPVERLSLHAEAMTQRGAALKKLADAAGPLYKSLDEGQKHRLVVLARLGERQLGGAHAHHRPGGWMHRGPSGPERGDGDARPPQ
jgi:zinc resistance-associated protein